MDMKRKEGMEPQRDAWNCALELRLNDIIFKYLRLIKLAI